jgi:hypothetical protein
MTDELADLRRRVEAECDRLSSLLPPPDPDADAKADRANALVPAAVAAGWGDDIVTLPALRPGHSYTIQHLCDPGEREAYFGACHAAHLAGETLPPPGPGAVGVTLGAGRNGRTLAVAGSEVSVAYWRCPSCGQAYLVESEGGAP